MHTADPDASTAPREQLPPGRYPASRSAIWFVTASVIALGAVLGVVIPVVCR